jgi:hypothetical protein
MTGNKIFPVSQTVRLVFNTDAATVLLAKILQQQLVRSQLQRLRPGNMRPRLVGEKFYKMLL